MKREPKKRHGWKIMKGKLPPGMKLNRTTGAITGKPTKVGLYYFEAIPPTNHPMAGGRSSHTIEVTRASNYGGAPL